MTTLGRALEGLEEVVAAHLPQWNVAVGQVLEVLTPAAVIGLPVATDYAAGPAGRAKYTVPITGVVDVTDSAWRDLLSIVSADELPAELAGMESDRWWGQIAVVSAGPAEVRPNGAGDCIAADLLVTFYA